MALNYNHNVDIKSTQAAKGLENIRSFLTTAGGHVSLYVLLIVLGTLGFTGIRFTQGHLATLSIPKPLSSSSFYSSLERNPVRTRNNYTGKHVAFHGRIIQLNNSTITLTSENGRAECRLPSWYFHKEWLNRSYLLELNVGEEISVSGIFSHENKGGFYLDQCTPNRFPTAQS